MPVPSYLFLYSEENALFFIKKFDRLCVPIYDVGSNYCINSVDAARLQRDETFLRWEGIDGINTIETVKG